MESGLVCLCYPDVHPWEREGIEPLISALSSKIDVSFEKVSRVHRGYFRAPAQGKAYWVICRDWKRASKYLKVRRSTAPVYMSVFGASPRHSLPGLIFHSVFGGIPPNVRLISHSPINFRFYREIAGLGSDQLFLLPLPLEKKPKPVKEEGSTLNVGTFVSIADRCNLNYFMSVAHYVAHRNQNVNFTIFGSGTLIEHFRKVVDEMGLAGRVSIQSATSLQSIKALDIFLFVSLQNEHFIPLLSAASYALPVVCSDVPGVTDLVQDGHTGFVVAVNDTKPMGELVLRLASDAGMRQAMGQQLCDTLRAGSSPHMLAEKYAALFLDTQADTQPIALRAASK